MRVSVLVMLFVGCTSGSGSTPGTDAGNDAGEDSGTADAGLAPPADAGVPLFIAADFCEVFARTSCRWAINCGLRAAAEETRCVAQVRFACPNRSSFDARAAQVCLLRLETTRCGPQALACEAAWPAASTDGGSCLTTADCSSGVCVRDGGVCGSCGPPLPVGAACDAFHPCEPMSRCADGDGGVLCRAQLAEGENCFGLGDSACASGRCAIGKCASASSGAPCSSMVGCPSGQFCDPVRSVCTIPPRLGEACDSQAACVPTNSACLLGKCRKITPFSIGEGTPCSETSQCIWGLACDTRATEPTCTRRIPYGADCQLKGLNVWDPLCPYLAMCHPVTRTCADSATLCSYGGFCKGGPGAGESCDAGTSCRGQSACADQDGGFRCVPLLALPGETCLEQVGSQACFRASCDAGVCGPWAVAPVCAL